MPAGELSSTANASIPASASSSHTNWASAFDGAVQTAVGFCRGMLDRVTYRQLCPEPTGWRRKNLPRPSAARKVGNENARRQSRNSDRRADDFQHVVDELDSFDSAEELL